MEKTIENYMETLGPSRGVCRETRGYDYLNNGEPN